MSTDKVDKSDEPMQISCEGASAVVSTKEEEKLEEKPVAEEVAKKAEDKDKKDDDKEDEGDDDDDDEDESSDEELPPGLLERPVEILEKKRERKKSVPFSFPDSSPKREESMELPVGKGVPLRDHPNVEANIVKNSLDDLRLIYKLFFGRKFEKRNIRNHIRGFSGFNFEKDSKDYEKKQEYLGKMTLANLKWTAEVIDCPFQAGPKNKEKIIEAILTWCLDPQPQAKKEKKKKKKTPKKTPKKTASKRKSEAGDDKNKSPTKKMKSSDDKTSPKKKKKPATPKVKIAVDKAASTKKKQTKKAVVKKAADSDGEDQPLVNSKTRQPTNENIREAVKTILKDADLENTTMKNVCFKVYQLFPGHDITDKKPYIKTIVKELISGS